MKQLDYSSLALDTLLVHSNTLSNTTNNSGKPTVEPIYTSTTYLHTNAETLDQSFSGRFPTGEPPDVIYVETLSNPLARVIDLDTISAIAQEVGAISIVDSTFTTPYLIRPIEHGFDLVVHSATKYLGGHGDSTAGVVISARNHFV